MFHGLFNVAFATERESSGFGALTQQHGIVSVAKKFACATLITAAFLLTAYGGGGGGAYSGGGDKCETLALCTLDTSFPAFTLTPTQIKSNKDYSPVSFELNASFVANLTARSILYTNSHLVNTDEYEKNGVIKDVNALVHIYPDNIELYLDSDINIVHTDAQFEKVYGTIPTDVVFVGRTKYYTDPATKFDSYKTLLVNSGTMSESDCRYDSGNNIWECTKTVGDLEYVWFADRAGGYAIWSIYNSIP